MTPLKTRHLTLSRRIKIYEDGQLEPMPGRTVEETLEMQIMQVLGKARDLTGQIAGRHLRAWQQCCGDGDFPGASGSMLNMTQIRPGVSASSPFVVSVSSVVMMTGRSRISRKATAVADAHGFIAHSYKGGLKTRPSSSSTQSVAVKGLWMRQSVYLTERVSPAPYDQRAAGSQGSI